jgi:hypothetical protein
VDTSGRNIDYVAIQTRKYEIESSASFNPGRDAIYTLSVHDLGKLGEEVHRVVAEASSKGKGLTVEFSVWGHAAANGPVGDELTSGDFALDKKQMTLKGWNQIAFNWKTGEASATFYGCKAAFTKDFLTAQQWKGLAKAGFFETASYPSLAKNEYVRNLRSTPGMLVRGTVDIDAVASAIREGEFTVGKDVGIWYVGIDQSEHQRNTVFGSDVAVRPLTWVYGTTPIFDFNPSDYLTPPGPKRLPVPQPVTKFVSPPSRKRSEGGSAACQFGPGSPDPRGKVFPGAGWR